MMFGLPIIAMLAAILYADKIGKDKSLGKLEVNPLELDGEEPKWFPLKVT